MLEKATGWISFIPIHVKSSNKTKMKYSVNNNDRQQKIVVKKKEKTYKTIS